MHDTYYEEYCNQRFNCFVSMPQRFKLKGTFSSYFGSISFRHPLDNNKMSTHLSKSSMQRTETQQNDGTHSWCKHVSTHLNSIHSCQSKVQVRSKSVNLEWQPTEWAKSPGEWKTRLGSGKTAAANLCGMLGLLLRSQSEKETLRKMWPHYYPFYFNFLPESSLVYILFIKRWVLNVKGTHK